MSLRAADLVHDPRHAARLDGADAAGHAAREGRQAWLGLWLDGTGRVARAAFRATGCASLIAYAEAACRLAEARGGGGVSAAVLRDAVAGVHPGHHDRAEIVADALARAWASRPHPSPHTGASP